MKILFDLLLTLFFCWSRLTACIVCCSAHLTLSLCSVHVQYYCSESVFVSSLCCSVELDFKLQEDKLQPLMKRLYPADESLFPPSAVSSGDHQLHAQTQVQSGGQETRALETLVSVTAGLHTTDRHIFSAGVYRQSIATGASVHLICFLIRTIQENPIRLFFCLFFWPFWYFMDASTELGLEIPQLVLIKKL